MSDKSMWRYGAHARSDAMSILLMLDEEFGIGKARKMYECLDGASLLDFAKSTEDAVTEFLGKTESQRPAFLRKQLRECNEHSRVAFLVLAVLAAMRVYDLVEIRDNYRADLSPGGGYRVTTAALFSMTTELADLFDYSWPSELVRDTGLSDCADDDDENE